MDYCPADTLTLLEMEKFSEIVVFCIRDEQLATCIIL